MKKTYLEIIPILFPTHDVNNGMQQNSKDFPLSIEQQQLLFPHHLHHNTPGYTIGIAIKLDGLLNQDAFIQALQEIVVRHELLRTTILKKNGNLYSNISHSFNSIYSTMDYSELKLNNSSLIDHAVKLFRLEMNKSFNLKKGPLIKLIFLKYSPHIHALIISGHHIIFDGWSGKIFFKELADVYNAFLENKTTPLMPLKYTYRDFVEKQNEQVYKNSMSASFNYWKSKLAGLSLFEFPTDKPRKNRDPIIKTYQFLFPSDIILQFNRFTVKHNVSPFVLILSTFGLLLYHYSEQDNFTIGVPFHGRTQLEIENLIGLFMKILPIKMSIDKNKSFLDLAYSTTKTVLEAHIHHQVSLAQLIYELNLEKTSNREPLYQVSLNFQNSFSTSYNFKRLECKTLELEAGQLLTDIDVEIYPYTNTYNTKTIFIDSYISFLKYDSNLYNIESIKDLTINWQELLRNILKSPDKLVSELMSNIKAIKSLSFKTKDKQKK